MREEKHSAEAIQHAHGLEKALRAKAAAYRDQANILEYYKEGRSRFAISYRKKADEYEAKANDLAQAIALQLFL